MKIDPTWRKEEPCGAFLIVKGGNPNNIADRVAFIEKTPRIRIRSPMVSSFGSGVLRPSHDDHLNWAGRPFKGDGPDDPESRKWCEDALKLFGYEFTSSR